MPAQALYLRWRPRTFDDVIGQDHITTTLRNALIQNRIRHAYLFNGPRGTGKTTMARILAKAVNCLDPDPAQRPCDHCRTCEAFNEGRFLDLIEIDAASHNGVDDVRDLREKIAFSPGEGGYKIYIIDEVHRFSPSAFDALLKTLEEPPNHAIFVLATTELEKVPATIRSRSLLFEFRRVSIQAVADRLQQIIDQEGVRAERTVLELVAQQGTGSVRDSISLLDQLIADPTQEITLDYAERSLGTASNRTVGRLVQAIIESDAASGLDLLNYAIDDGADPGQLGRQIVGFLRNLLLVQTGGPLLVEASDEMREQYQAQAQAITRSRLIQAVKAFNAAVSEVRSGWQPQLPLELALIESVRPPAEPAYAEVVPRREASPVVAASTSAPPSQEETETAESSGEQEKQDMSPLKLSDLQQAWPEIMAHLRQANQVPLFELLRTASVSLHSLENGVLVLAIGEKVFRDQLDGAKAEKKRHELIKAINAVLKVKLGIRIISGRTGTVAKVDDKIANDPLIGNEMRSGAVIYYEEDNQGGSEQ